MRNNLGFREPILRCSVFDARKIVRSGGCLAVIAKTGHAEVWDGDGFCVGYLTRRQVETYNKLGVKKESACQK